MADIRIAQNAGRGAAPSAPGRGAPPPGFGRGPAHTGPVPALEFLARIRQRSGTFIEPGEGWLYPALHRLEADGALEASWREGDQGPRRRYYRITAAGLRLLAEQEREWDAFARSVRQVTRGEVADGPA